jgi:hypothetical protein
MLVAPSGLDVQHQLSTAWRLRDDKTVVTTKQTHEKEKKSIKEQESINHVSKAVLCNYICRQIVNYCDSKPTLTYIKN